MKGAPDDRRLTIGAYAAATQLTAKALRLYDEQGLLRPSTIDAATGYRYYRVEQVAKGRLIRALREMYLSLAQIAQRSMRHPQRDRCYCEAFCKRRNSAWLASATHIRRL